MQGRPSASGTLTRSCEGDRPERGQTLCEKFKNQIRKKGDDAQWKQWEKESGAVMNSFYLILGELRD